MKAKQFIKDCTRGYNNACGLDKNGALYFHEWLTPDEAERAAEIAMEELWKDAQGDDLPEIDREVIVLYQPCPCEGNEYAVSFAHRPPERWYGRSLDGEEHVFKPKTYDKGEWNIPNVVWWLDLNLPIKGK